MKTVVLLACLTGLPTVAFAQAAVAGFRQGLVWRSNRRRDRRGERPRAHRTVAYDGHRRGRAIPHRRPQARYLRSEILASGLEHPIGRRTSSSRVPFTATVNAELAIGPLTETVIVTAEVTAVDVHSAKKEVTLGAEVVRSIPTVRSYNALLALVPGVVTNVERHGHRHSDDVVPHSRRPCERGAPLARRIERRESAERQFGDELRRRHRPGAGGHVHHGRRSGRDRNRGPRDEHRAQERREHDARLVLRQRHRRDGSSPTI